MADLVLKFRNFRYDDNKDQCMVNFNDTLKSPDLENRLCSARIPTLSLM